MDSAERQALRSAAEQRHRERMAESERELQSDLDAIARVARLQGLNETPEKIDENGRQFEHGGLQTLVSEAVTLCTRAKFTAGNIETQIRQAHPHINGTLNRKAVNGVLRRLVIKNEVRVKKQGKGRRATIYAKGGGSE